MTDRPENEPGFWPDYREPATNVARAIQYPLDERFADRIVAAYAQDAKAARGKKV